MRILGVDYGTKYIGFAISDAGNFIANPVRVCKINDTSDILALIRDMSRELDAETIVMGLPFSLGGAVSIRGETIRKLCRTLETELRIPVIEWDERFTSYAAGQLLENAGVKKKNQKKKIDKIAAALILQSYLDHVNRAGATT